MNVIKFPEHTEYIGQGQYIRYYNAEPIDALVDTINLKISQCTNQQEKEAIESIHYNYYEGAIKAYKHVLSLMEIENKNDLA